MNAQRVIVRSTCVVGACVAGAVCALLALIPTATWAEYFAHPVRVARLGGAIPEATTQGAFAFRVTLAVAAFAIPAVVLLLEKSLAKQRGTPIGVPVRSTFGSPQAREVSPTVGDQLAFPIFLLCCIVGGALVRIALAAESLWYDEISALLSFALEGPGVAFGSYTVPTNHVPMTLAMWAMVMLTGSVSEFAVRAPAVIAGVVAIPVAWSLAREVAPTALRDRLARAMAFVVAFAPIPALESAEARGYSFVILGSLVAALFLSRARRTHAAIDWVAFAAACAFAAWAHPVAILVPIVTGVIGIFRERTLTLSSLLAGILAAVVLAPLVGDVLATRADYVHGTADQPTFFSREGVEAITGLSLSWGLALPTAPWTAWIAFTPLPAWLVGLPYVLIALFGLGIARLVRDRAFDRARATALPFAIAFVVAIALSLFLGTWIYARFLLFAVPVSALAIGLALASIERTRPRATIFCLVALQALAAYAVYWKKQPIRDAVEAVAAARGDAASTAQRVLTIGLPDNAVGFYASPFGFEAEPTGFLGADLASKLEPAKPTGEAPTSPHAHAASVSAEFVPPTFIIVLYPERLSADVLATLDARFDRTHRFEGWADWGHGAVEVWRASDARGAGR